MSDSANGHGTRAASPGHRPKSRSVAKTLGHLDPRQLKHVTHSTRKAADVVEGARYDVRYKVVLLGESGVGKTSLIRAAVREPFNPTMISTIGIDFIEQTYDVENYRIQLQIWDTAGQERYRSLAASTFRDAKAFIIVYDITNHESFTKVREEWLKMTDVQGGDPVPVFLVGNKIDLTRLREVSRDTGSNFAKQQYSHGFFETSALTGENIQKLFQSVAVAMLSTWSLPQLHGQASTSANSTTNNNAAFGLSQQTRSSTKPKKKSTVIQCCAN